MTGIPYEEISRRGGGIAASAHALADTREHASRVVAIVLMKRNKPKAVPAMAGMPSSMGPGGLLVVLSSIAGRQ